MAGVAGKTVSTTSLNVEVVNTDKSLRQAVTDGDLVKTVKKKITGDTTDLLLSLDTSKRTTAGTAAGVAAVIPVTVDGEAAVADFTAKDFHRYLAGHWNERVFQGSGDFKSLWVDSLIRGGYFVDYAEPGLSLRSDAPKPTCSMKPRLRLKLWP